MAAGETLVVLATDPEAPIDLAALATDEGHEFACESVERADEGHELASEPVRGEWRMTLRKLP
jgi:TusA-related sulfurtransferase